MTSSSVIAKNTLFLYFRMCLILGVTLYTSRVVLNMLGVSDYGIYNLVGGIIAMLGFFNAAMSAATQRYLSFDLGQNNTERLKKTFGMTLTIHITISLLVLLLAETIGLWYINNKMVYPSARSHAVQIVYQFSVLTFLLSIIQVPYNALILARERMSVYAYISVIEALLKLAVVFMLAYWKEDKLIAYSLFTFFVALVIRLLYQLYCRRNFPESRYKFIFDRTYFRELIVYSGWNLFGNIALVARNQGNNLVLNLFFGTVVNAAYGITNQVLAAVSMFVTGFQQAINPQIIKNFAQGNISQTHKLIFQASKFSYFLVLVLVCPVWYNIDFILKIWLLEPPHYTNVFIRLSLIVLLIDSVSGPLMTGTQATGKIKWYQIIIGILSFLNLPVSYLFLKIMNTPPTVVFIVMIVLSIIALFFRLYFLNKVLNFPIKFFCTKILGKILLVTGLSCIIFYHLLPLFGRNTWESFFLISIFIIIVILSLFMSLGTNKEEKVFIKKRIVTRVFKR